VYSQLEKETSPNSEFIHVNFYEESHVLSLSIKPTKNSLARVIDNNPNYIDTVKPYFVTLQVDDGTY